MTAEQIPAWLAYAGVPLADVPEDQRAEVEEHRRQLDDPSQYQAQARGGHPVHDLISNAERQAAYLRVMTAGELTLAVVHNIAPAAESSGVLERLRVAEAREGIPWGKAQEEAARLVKVYDDAVRLARGEMTPRGE